jgi:hypothetical protein
MIRRYRASVDDAAARNAYRNLRDDLACIAWEAEEQIAWMRRHRWGADELAIQLLNDDYPVAPALRERGWLPAAVDGLIEEMGSVFDSLGSVGSSGDAGWSDEALRTDARWGKLRHLAREALQALPEEPRVQ